MFTGLVEELGTLQTIHVHPTTQQTILTIQANLVLQGVQLGDSIAVNGVCLTVTSFNTTSEPKLFTVGLSPETLRRTNLGELKPGDLLNLERSLTPTSHIGGHFVQGHVDGTAVIDSMTRDQDSLRVFVRTPATLLRYIVEKGYVAIDGTSLTVCTVNDIGFEVMLIQYTQEKVTLSRKKVGDKVNIETDILGKQIVHYLDKFLGSRVTQGAQAAQQGSQTGDSSNASSAPTLPNVSSNALSDALSRLIPPKL